MRFSGRILFSKCFSASAYQKFICWPLTFKVEVDSWSRQWVLIKWILCHQIETGDWDILLHLFFSITFCESWVELDIANRWSLTLLIDFSFLLLHVFLLIPWYLGKIILFYKGLSLLSAVLVCRVDMSLAACFTQKTVYNFKYCKLCMTLLGWQWEGYQWFLRYDVESVGPIYGHLQINLEVSQISIHAKTY